MVLVLSISFVGYIAMKILGAKKGLALTGLFGGFASSTSVAVTMAERSKENRGILHSAVFAVVVASTTMFIRAVLVSSIINPSVGYLLIIPLVMIAASGYALSYYSWTKIKREVKINIGSPLALKPAIKFMIIFALVLFISKIVQTYFPNWIYAFSVVAGLVEVDAVTISLSSMAFTGLSPIIAAKGIILACISNTVSKWLLINWLGKREMGMEVGKSFAAILGMGAFIFLFLSII
jgi:uncharacterized membrane protein (DUF4010 family)